MISKGLLREIIKSDYNCEIYDFQVVATTIKINSVRHKQSPLNDELFLTNIPYGWQKIYNIYELANKCKEWALSQGYMMKIENHYLNSIQIQIRKSVANSKYIEPWKKTFKSEVEAVIKACQWILDNKDIK